MKPKTRLAPTRAHLIFRFNVAGGQVWLIALAGLGGIPNSRGIDSFMNYWGSKAIAHTILSFDFADSPPVAISIETRKQIGETYSALLGFSASTNWCT